MLQALVAWRRKGRFFRHYNIYIVTVLKPLNTF
jgi:hypothetical protein